MDAKDILSWKWRDRGIGMINSDATNLLIHKTGGNPLYIDLISEVIRMSPLLQEYFFSPRPLDQSDLVNIERHLPRTMEACVILLYGSLDHRFQYLLKAGSVYGDYFELEAIANIIEPKCSVSDLSGWIEAFDRFSFLFPYGLDINNLEKRFAFRHSFIRRVIYESIPGRKCKDMHMGILNYFEDLIGTDPNEVLPLVCFHASRSEDMPRHISHLSRFADLCLSRWMLPECAHALESLINISHVKKSQDLASFARWWSDLALVQIHSGNAKEALSSAKRALECIGVSWPKSSQDYKIVITKEYVKQIALWAYTSKGQKSLKKSSKKKEPRVRGEILAKIFGTLPEILHAGSSLSPYDKYLASLWNLNDALAKISETPAEFAKACARAAHYFWYTNKKLMGKKYLKRALQLLPAVADTHDSYYLISQILEAEGKLDQSLKLKMECMSIAESFGDHAFIRKMLVSSTYTLLDLAEFDRVQDNCKLILSLAFSEDDHMSRALSFSASIFCSIIIDDVESSRLEVRALAEALPKVGGTARRAIMMGALCLYYTRTGEFQPAIKLLSDMANFCESFQTHSLVSMKIFRKVLSIASLIPFLLITEWRSLNRPFLSSIISKIVKVNGAAWGKTCKAAKSSGLRYNIALALLDNNIRRAREMLAAGLLKIGHESWNGGPLELSLTYAVACRFSDLLRVLPDQKRGMLNELEERRFISLLRDALPAGGTGKPVSSQTIEEYRLKVKEMFYHGYHSYMSLAFPLDELKPLSGTGFDTIGNFSLTLVDALDTLMVRIESIALNLKDLRVMGGLLSCHILAVMDPQVSKFYDRSLLDKAEDLGNRLLVAFDTPTGLPYGTINLKNGVNKDESEDVCTACAGSFSIEFTWLSLLTDNPKYEIAARRAMRALWKRRSSIDLFGNHINVRTGEWTYRECSVGGLVDSYYEYLLKSYVAFSDEEEYNGMFWRVEYISTYPLRPEYVESLLHAFRATKDNNILHLGMEIVDRLNNITRTKNGFSNVVDVRTGKLEDKMESFFLAETLKYLYLLFDPQNPFNTRNYIFNTEAHPFPVWNSHFTTKHPLRDDEEISVRSEQLPVHSKADSSYYGDERDRVTTGFVHGKCWAEDWKDALAQTIYHLKARALAIPGPSGFQLRKGASGTDGSSVDPRLAIKRLSNVGLYVQGVASQKKRKRPSEAGNADDIDERNLSSSMAASAKVVVFDDSSAAGKANGMSSYEKRVFMSSDVSKLFNDGTKKLSTEEEEQEKEDDNHDRELMDLIKSTRLLEEFTASELTGKDRRAFLEKKISDLGGKVVFYFLFGGLILIIATQDSKKYRAPPPIRVGIIKAEKVRAQKRLQTAKDMGLYHSSLKSQILNGDEKPASIKKKKKKERELGGSIGSFSNGVLHVPKGVIKSTNASASQSGVSKRRSDSFLDRLDGPRDRIKGKGKSKGKGKKKRK
ncbi:ER degradation-enhancing alpha-mannosidase-like protein 2 [Dinochytrium kinnereticum]|nr:ER degradation-enhancing alpha-mannosidase-like protein 2 [Dinochytrium kinnereticum]